MVPPNYDRDMTINGILKRPTKAWGAANAPGVDGSPFERAFPWATDDPARRADRLNSTGTRGVRARRSPRRAGRRVPVADSAPLSAKLLRKGRLKVYEKFPHGMCTTHADVINPDLLAFIKA